jgi:flagellar M-ring protein FliF
MNQLVPLLKNSTPKAKIGLAVGAVATIVVFFLLFKMATAPSFETLATGVDPAETGKITKTLDEQGIAYEIQNAGTAVGVKSADAARARIALAEAGLPGKGQAGFELFDKQKMGTSDFQQKVNYQRALEGEIANTISQVEGVDGAKVQLVMPEDSLFAEEREPATAAVLLEGDGSMLEPSAVRGMAQLVSSSVKGLALDKVTITDGKGNLLWPREGSDASGGTLSKAAAEQRHNQMLQSQLTALLASTVGPDKAQVRVSSEINVDKAKEKKLIYGEDQNGDAPELKAQTEEETLESEGGNGGGGRAGTAGNVPNYAGNAGGGGGESNYERRSENVERGVNKTVRETEFAPGTIERQNVAVVLDASVPPAVAREVQTAVASAAGIDVGRGDELTVSRVAFAKTPEEAKPNALAGYLQYAKWAALGLAVLLFLFFITRALRKRESEALGEPVWLREITAPQPLAALEADTVALSQTAIERNNVRRRAEELAAKEPQKVAQQLRAWMAEEA